LVHNGGETDVDCGGSCASKCELGQACARNDDCASNVCNAGACVDCVHANDCMRGAQSAECVRYTCDTHVCHATALTPAQTPYDCTDKLCNADHSLTLLPDLGDVESDAAGDCYKYACECDSSGCSKHVDFEPNDTPAQVSGDCHIEQCVASGQLPHAFNAVDTADKPSVAPACHSVACDASGATIYPVSTANIENDNNDCTTDSCDNAGNPHHVVHADPGFCSGICGTAVDRCGVQHDCNAENNPCSALDCGQRGNGCAIYNCPVNCAGDNEYCGSNHRCDTRSGGSSSGGTSGGGTKPPCCNKNPPTCADQC